MIYDSLDELHKKYKNKYGKIKKRNEMSRRELENYINDLFDTYEKIGFRERLTSENTNTKEHDGLKFEVVCRINPLECGYDVAPLWEIKLETGKTTIAFPEEICLAIHPEEQEN